MQPGDQPFKPEARPQYNQPPMAQPQYFEQPAPQPGVNRVSYVNSQKYGSIIGQYQVGLVSIGDRVQLYKLVPGSTQVETVMFDVDIRQFKKVSQANGVLILKTADKTYWLDFASIMMSNPTSAAGVSGAQDLQWWLQLFQSNGYNVSAASPGFKIVFAVAGAVIFLMVLMFVMISISG